MSAQPLLSIRDLHVSFHTLRGVVRAVRGLNLDVAAGETVALVGESGCGKTVTALAVLGEGWFARRRVNTDMSQRAA